MSWLHLLLGAVAYRALATDGSAGVAGQDIEDLLFEPSEKSALLVLAVAAWLVYRRRHHILALPVASASAGVLALFLVPGTLLFGWALYTGATDLLLISLGLEALGVCAAWRGNAATRALWLPAFCLVLAVPIPAPLLSEIVWSFQLWTAQLGGWMLSAIGVPVFVSGDLIFRARDTFQVIESCSGLRSVETLTLLAILMVDLFRRRGAHAVLLVAAAPPCAFAINGFRVVTIMLNPHSETIAIHTLQGIVVLQVGLLVLYFFDMGLRRWLKHEPVPVPSPTHDRLPITPTTRRSSATAVLVAALGFSRSSETGRPCQTASKSSSRVTN